MAQKYLEYPLIYAKVKKQNFYAMYQLYILFTPSLKVTLCFHPKDLILELSINFLNVPSGLALLNINSPLYPTMFLINIAKFLIENFSPDPILI